MTEPKPSVRVDRWLLATRSFKTRSQATEACAAGHVKINGDSVKAAKKLYIGDRVEVRSLRGLRMLEVVALGEKRMSATEAEKLFIDHTPPEPPRATRPIPVQRERGAGRPTKRERRRLNQIFDE